MTERPGSDSDGHSAQERVEAKAEQITRGASRVIGRVLGRAREELEDMVAEARSINRREPPSGTGTGTGTGR